MADTKVDADAFNRFEAAGWEKQAAGYEGFFGPITKRLVAPLLEAAEVGDGTRVLDVATGPGYVAAEAVGRGAEAVGLDKAEAMLAIARQLNPQLDLRAGDVEDLPFPDSSFDAVVGNFILLHLGRPERAVQEFVRVLAPEGRLALTVWDVPERARLLGVLLEAAAEAGASQATLPTGPPIFRFADEREFDRLLRGQGLEQVEVQTIGFSLSVTSTEELWRGLLGGSVRLSALVLAQPDDVQERIHDAFDRIAEQHRAGDRLEIPVSVKLASGRKG